MRISVISVAGGLMALSLSSALLAQRADDQIDPRSAALVEDARAARASGNLEAANDALESALAVDPRNRPAFVLLGDIARSTGLPGKAIRLYREALMLEPADLAALRGQGEALVAKGAVEKAKENLAKIKTVCGTASCGDANALAASIAKGPPVSTAQSDPVEVKPSVTPTPAKP